MHEATFAQAALPAPTICLGLPLRPYSLGHELYLIREFDGEPSLDDLPAAVLICCQTWAELHRPDWLLRLKLAIWRRRIARMDLEIEFAVFELYRLCGSRHLPVSKILRPGRVIQREPGAPYLLQLHQLLVTRFRKSECEAWDYPYGLAKMQWQAWWESEGGMEIKNEAEAKHEQVVAEMELEDLRKGTECPA